VTGLGGVPVKGVFDFSQVDYKNPETFPQHTTEELPEGKQRGVCKWFDVTKGYGFITPADSTEDIFVHQSALLCAKDAVSRTLVTGENIEFELDTDDSGRKKAQNVTGPAGSNVLGQPQPRPSVLPYQQPLVGRYPGYAPSPYGGYGGGGFRQGYSGYRR
jgi:cold shock CspA family protein